MSANTGGTAFHLPDRYAAEGMTLLDWYAGQALAWCLSEFAGNAEDGTQYAEAAYQIADAMLAEKARREAVVQQSSTTDHSRDAGKMAEIQAANRELVEALRLAVTHVEFFTSPPKGSIAEDGRNALLLKFSAILAKHKGAK